MSKVIILCGIPGSGKSTISKESFPDYKRINQDELGNRGACIEAFHEFAVNGNNIIVDRTNITKDQRAIWTDLARFYNMQVTCVYIEMNEEEAINRIMLRKNHPTIKETMNEEKKRSIVYKFNRDLEIPSLSENFDQIIMIRG